jgi:hypothetical protein
MRFPIADGTADQVLITDGQGVLQWATVSGAGPIELNDIADVFVATPAASNFLAYSGAGWQNRNILSSDLPLSGVSQGTHGSTTTIPIITVDDTGRITAVTTGDIPSSTISQQGIVALATAAETITGTDNTKAVTPAGLTAVANTLQPLDATLTALASITTANDTMPFFTGTNTATTTNLSAFGRSLIDDADAIAARTTIGLGTAAISNVTTNNTDATLGHVIRVGDFGLGNSGGVTAVTLDDPSANRTGFYVHTNGMPGFTPPAGQNGGLVQQYNRTTDSILGQTTQIYTNAGTQSARMWIRTANNNTFGAWEELWTSSNLVRTTSNIDSAASRITQVGDGGILNTGNAPVIVSLDTTASMPSALYRFSNAVSLGTRPPGAAANGTVLVERFSSTIIKQTWTDVVGGSAIAPRTWIRTSSGVDTWGTWREAALDVGTAAFGTLATSISDNTLGRVMRIGDFGIGGPGIPETTDANAARVSGNYVFSNATLNTPIANAWFTCTVNGGNQFVQQLWAMNPRCFVRSSAIDGVNWSVWSEVARLGTSPIFTNLSTNFINHGFVAGGTVTIDPLAAADQAIWWTANGTIAFNTTNLANDTSAVLTIQIIGANNFTTTWPSGIQWPNGQVPPRVGVCFYTFNIRRASDGSMQIAGFLSGSSMGAV